MSSNEVCQYCFFATTGSIGVVDISVVSTDQHKVTLLVLGQNLYINVNLQYINVNL